METPTQQIVSRARAVYQACYPPEGKDATSRCMCTLVEECVRYLQVLGNRYAGKESPRNEFWVERTRCDLREYASRLFGKATWNKWPGALLLQTIVLVMRLSDSSKVTQEEQLSYAEREGHAGGWNSWEEDLEIANEKKAAITQILNRAEKHACFLDRKQQYAEAREVRTKARQQAAFLKDQVREILKWNEKVRRFYHQPPVKNELAPFTPHNTHCMLGTCFSLAYKMLHDDSHPNTENMYVVSDWCTYPSVTKLSRNEFQACQRLENCTHVSVADERDLLHDLVSTVFHREWQAMQKQAKVTTLWQQYSYYFETGGFSCMLLEIRMRSLWWHWRQDYLRMLRKRKPPANTDYVATKKLKTSQQ